MEPKLVLIERGDTLLFRNDIPHAGAENLTDHQNVRLHSFMTVDDWELPLNQGFTNRAAKWNDVPNLKWDAEIFKFKVV